MTKVDLWRLSGRFRKRPHARLGGSHSDRNFENPYIYTRVSTKDHANNGISLDALFAAGTQYAEGHHLQVIDVIVDTMSGKFTDRHGFQRLLKLISGRKIKHLISMKLDGLSSNTIDTLNLLNLMGQKNVELHLADSGRADTTSADDEYMMTLRAGFAQAERRKISERTKAAFGRKKSLGQRISGKAPYAYEFPDGKVVANQSEQQTLLTIRELKSKGRFPMVHDLKKRGIYNREGKSFSISVIHKMLSAA